MRNLERNALPKRFHGRAARVTRRSGRSLEHDLGRINAPPQVSRTSANEFLVQIMLDEKKVGVMRVLVVEDDDAKRDELLTFLRKLL